MRHYIEAGPEFLREIRYGTHMWVREKNPDAKAPPEEQALRLRGKASQQRDEWLLSDDTVMTSAELAETFYVCLPEIRR